ncbi:hypothetical protein DYB32_005480 [Aphanomyces invadans]|uniref:Uncharacterized protein n=1 Tax=Aphanomyces invadans TaxID=157072 RepID=A0A3R6Y7W9_9STRA|nr:hypothetical protein DYB32_005480 [Aphanomyces invadans]
MCLKRGTVSLYRYVALANSMIESTLPSAPFTLLKHDGAFLVETNTFARGAVTESKQQTTRGTTGQSLVSPEILKAMLPSRYFPQLNPSSQKLRREWKDENGKWQQNVSMEPSSRAEVLELQETLASNLVKEQAKQVGICANRERLHAQLFGKKTTVVHRSTSLSFGLRKTVLAEEGTQEIEDKIAGLEDEIKQLKEEALQWSHRSMILQSHYANEREKRTTQQTNVVAALQAQIHQFEAFRDLTK